MSLKPRVKVLLTTYNGAQHLWEQVETISRQEGCDVFIEASDDFSKDETLPMLEDFAAKNPGRIAISRPPARSGSAGKNFFGLIARADLKGFDYVAFSDQDDIWKPSHLILSIEEMQRSGASGVSSNVTAFWKDGTKRLYKKNQPQRSLDFLFESAGTGCTYVMTAAFFHRVQNLVLSQPELPDKVYHHDWLVYALARAERRVWVIRDQPTLMYRQHERNETGARFGLKAIQARISKVRSGWYRGQVLAIAGSLLLAGAPVDQTLVTRLDRLSFGDRLWLMRRVSDFRRAVGDQAAMFLLVGCGLF